MKSPLHALTGPPAPYFPHPRWGWVIRYQGDADGTRMEGPDLKRRRWFVWIEFVLTHVLSVRAIVRVDLPGAQRRGRNMRNNMQQAG